MGRYGLREIGMKWGFGIALVLAGCMGMASGPFAQARQQDGTAAPGQDKQSGNTAAQSPNGQPGSQPKPQEGANSFPTDTSNVPVLPSTLTPDVSVPTSDEMEGRRFSLPSSDLDPVASPDQANSDDANTRELESSSNVKALDSILPQPGADEPRKKGKKGSDVLEGPPRETAKQDISVGKYYLDNKNWRAALSRFQSALVLAPDEPEVYWGLAESQRHMGDYANAKKNYEKVIEYDPDSKHAKDAKKALKEPQLANAKAAPQTQDGQTPR